MTTLRIINEPAGLVITPDSYRSHEQHRRIGDRLMTEYGYDSNRVMEARITEAAIEVDVILEPHPDGTIVRTHRHDLVTGEHTSTEALQP